LLSPKSQKVSSGLIQSFSAWADTVHPSHAKFTCSKDADCSCPKLTAAVQTLEIPSETSFYAEESEIVTSIAQTLAHAFIHAIVIGRRDGNCLFDTTSGCPGIAIVEVRKDDAVYLISGTRLPMVVRKCDGFCRLVGCAYMVLCKENFGFKI
jgi:hypothetical protein